MKPQCVAAVEAHLSSIAGKAVKLTPAAIKRIDDRMKEGAKVLARRDRNAWSAMTPEARTVEIGKWVRSQEQEAADATARGQVRQLAALTTKARVLADMAAARPDKAGKWSRGLVDVLEGVDNTVQGAEQVALRGFNDLMRSIDRDGSVFDFHSTKSDAFFGDVTREIYGVDTGNPAAKQFASKWSALMEADRQARNRAGGTVGKLDKFAPQTHDATVMQRKGKDVWSDFVMKNLDREQYLDANGATLGDAELRPVVEKMFDTLVSDAANKIKIDTKAGLAESAPAGGSSNIAKMDNGKHREIHLKDADALIAYNKEFSDRSLGSSYFQHMTGSAREIALMREFGPNPDTTFATLRDTAKSRDSKMPGFTSNKDGNVKGGGRAGFTPEAYYRQMRGNSDFATIDEISTALVGYQAATKLTSTALRAPFQDTPGILLNMADVGQLTKIGTVLRTAFSPKEAERFGIGAEVALRESQRGAQRIMSQGRFNVGNAVSRYAQATMRYTLLDAWTNAARRAGQTSHLLALGEWSGKAWDKLDNSQQGLLRNAGITADDWAHIQRIPRQKLRGNDVHDVSDVDTLGLSTDDTAALQAKMMGFVRMGGDIVTSEHNLTAQTIMSMGGRTNALTKQVMLFKNAGAVQTAHMLDRLSRKSAAGKVGYVGATAALGAGFGYMALAAQAITAGQNPPPWNDPRTVAKALAVSGGFAMVQDLVTSMYDAVSGDNAGHSSSAVPIFGDMATLAKIGFMATQEDTRDKAGYMAIKMARQQFAPLNYWYTKTLVDHLFFNDAAEAMNPGYQKRLRQYADQKGQQYFYDPSGTGGADFGIGEYKKPFGE